MLFAFRNAGSSTDYIIFTLFLLIAVCVALVLHEVAHGLVAKWNGDYTAQYEGRLTLNPIKHFDPIGLVMMLTVGFGYAKPVPVNPYNFRHYRKGLFTVAIAGICMNFILAFLSALFFNLMFLGYINTGAEAFWYFMQFFSISMQINIAFAFFNLLPVFPLDGFRIVETFTHRGNKFCAFMRTNGQYILWGLVGLSLIVGMAGRYVALPSWFEYVNVLGLYINFFVSKVEWLFVNFWALMMPPVRELLWLVGM
ncbi:MAG: site-2 protease family protein [Clostridiales bacterium]|nr:site-2 protease family protein [Clostridiales bacterium]